MKCKECKGTGKIYHEESHRWCGCSAGRKHVMRIVTASRKERDETRVPLL